MRKTFRFTSFLFIILALGLAACGGSSSDAPAQAVEAYWQTFATQDSNQLSALTCADYEATALMNLTSFQSVALTLKDLQCTTESVEGDSAEVTCVGALSASYGAEVTDFDLGINTYLVVKQGGDWLMCGEK